MNKQQFLEKVLIKRPNVNQEYDYSLLPDSFVMHDKVSVICKSHGVFSQRAYSHISGQGCPACGREKCDNARTKSSDHVIRRMKKKFGDCYTYEKFVYRGQLVPAVITCREHGDIIVVPKDFIGNGNGCPACSRTKKVLQWIDKAKECHNDYYDYSKVKRDAYLMEKVEIVCPKHGSFWQCLSDHANKENGCWHCGRESTRKDQSNFIDKAKKIHGDKYRYDKTEYITDAHKVLITCLKHGDFYQRPSSHLSGNGCKHCFLEGQLLSAEEFIENARKIHGDNYCYDKVKYRGNKVKVEIVCPKHGSFWQKPNSHISIKAGCWMCSESKGEREIEIVLKKYGINHVREHRMTPYKYRYDFYLPDYNVFIEFNGLQHYRPVNIFGGENGFKNTKRRDRKKRELVKKQKGKLIILTYQHLGNNSVEKTLVSKLKKLKVL